MYDDSSARTEEVVDQEVVVVGGGGILVAFAGDLMDSPNTYMHASILRLPKSSVVYDPSWTIVISRS